jgi:hypothetical protein
MTRWRDFNLWKVRRQRSSIQNAYVISDKAFKKDSLVKEMRSSSNLGNPSADVFVKSMNAAWHFHSKVRSAVKSLNTVTEDCWHASIRTENWRRQELEDLASTSKASQESGSIWGEYEL